MCIVVKVIKNYFNYFYFLLKYYLGDFMDSKLQMLLDKININHEYYKYFNDSKLIKIVGNKNRDSYCFFIESINTIGVDVYDIFYACLKKCFKKH